MTKPIDTSKKHLLFVLLELICLALAILMILFAVLVTLARSASPYLNHHIKRIEKTLSKEINQPVHIGRIEMWWQGFGPVVELKNVRIGHSIQSHEIHVNIDLIQSALQRQFAISSVKITGGIYLIKQEPKGGFMVNGVHLGANLPQAPAGQSSVLKWLFSEAQVSLNDMSIRYINVNHNVIAGHIDYLTLSNDNSDHMLSGHVTLTKPYLVPLRFNLTATGDVSQPKTLLAKLYLQTPRLNLVDVLGNQQFQGERLTQGSIGGRLWLTWQNQRVTTVQSQLLLNDVVVKSVKQWLQIPRFSANIAWQRQSNQDWLFTADQVHLIVNHHAWPAEAVYVAKKTKPDQLTIALQYLSLDDLRMLLNHVTLLSGSVLSSLDKMHPEGSIQDLVIQKEGEQWSPHTVGLSGRLNQFAMHRLGHVPTLKNINANLYWNQHEGAVILNSQNAQFGDADVFKQPLQFQNLFVHLRLQWLKNQPMQFYIDQLYADDPVFAAHLIGLIQVDPKRPNHPFVSYMTNFHVLKLQKIGYYLPVEIMPPDTVNWLEQAFLSGQLYSQSVFRGRADRFPFQTSGETFEVDSTVKNIRLSFNSKWPLVSTQAAKMDFANDQFNTTIAKAVFDHIVVTNLDIQIPTLDAKNPQLFVKGKMAGKFKDAVDLMLHSPLHDTIGANMQTMHPRGLLGLQMQLAVPLDHTHDTKLFGRLHFMDVSAWLLGIPDAINHLQGDVQFTNDTVSSDVMTALVFGEPSRARFGTDARDKDNAYLLITGETKFNSKNFEKLFGFPLEHFVEGVTPYKVFVKRPMNTKKGDAGIRIQVQSDLKGVSVDLPEDLKKPKNQARLFQLKLDYFNKQFTTVQFNYGGLLSGDVDMMHKAEAQNQSGAVGLSASVSLHQFELATWEAFFRSKSWLMQSTESATGHFSQWKNKLVGLNLHADSVKAYGQSLKSVSLTLLPKPNAWTLNVKSNDIDGLIVWPQVKHHYSFSATFKRLYLLPIPMAAQSATFNPSLLPAVRLRATDFRYDHHYHLSNVIWDSQPLTNGIQVKEFSVHSPLLTANLQGRWLMYGRRNQTMVSGNASSNNIAHLLEKLNIKRGAGLTNGRAQFNLTWLSKPYTPSIASLSGKMMVSLGPGNIGDLGKSTMNKINMGRLLNALSVQSILNKLTFNSQEYKTGYNFTSMTGDFEIKNSLVHTNKTEFVGPIATIVLSGNVDLDKKQYDLKLDVTPHVTGSLPVVAGLLVNPVVGVAAWFANTLFSPAVGELTTRHFQMTGSWDKPNIQSLDKKKSGAA